ncbi:beta-lactamase family protein [Kitasatospora sp. DSM 101779]|nr:beta-lactamase family protein [Kitasatospora sp. DSM 101779]
MKRLPALVAAAAASLVLLPSSAQAQTSGDHAGTLAALKTFQAAAGPGAAINAGDATNSYSLAVGTGTINANLPILPTDHFRIGSQTKTLTATAVLQLVDEGKVVLDTPIETYLPGVVDGNGYHGDTITVRQLLQHSSGIPANDPPNPQASPDGTYTLAALVRDGLGHPPASAPGTTFAYSNTNYEILGLLIERITGLPVRQVITNRIIEPLDLTGTSFPAAGDRTVPTPAVHGYHGIRIGIFNLWTDLGTALEPSIYSTSGAMISTLRDVTAFDQALMGGRLLSPATLAEMKKTVAVGGGLSYGLGVAAHTLPCGGAAWGHDGIVNGYYSETLVTEDGRHASVVTNAHLATNAPIAQMYNLLDTALCEATP